MRTGRSFCFEILLFMLYTECDSSCQYPSQDLARYAGTFDQLEIISWLSMRLGMSRVLNRPEEQDEDLSRQCSQPNNKGLVSFISCRAVGRGAAGLNGHLASRD